MSVGLRLVAAILVLVGGGVHGSQGADWKAEADALAGHHGWTELWLEAGSFDLLSYVPEQGDRGKDLTVYIEGDGRPWITRTQQADDPTPRTPRVLELALSDSTHTAYLARPCQYLPPSRLQACNPDFWSLARYGEDVVEAIDTALDALRARGGADGLRLVGYSGGGQLAILAAARRDDVRSIITIVSNLDHALWTRNLGVTSLRASLNAADVARAVQHIPQVHFLGEEDTNVSTGVLDSYLARMTDTTRSRVIIVPEFTHACCWRDAWRGLAAAAAKMIDELQRTKTSVDSSEDPGLKQ